MYFSKNNKLSRILSLILVCALAVTLFAGCKKEDASTEPENTVPGLNLNLSEQTEPPAAETQAPTTEATEPNENMGTVTQQMNIRGTPSQQAAILGTLYAGDRVEVNRREKIGSYTWAYITSPEEGWVVTDYIEMDVKTEDSAVGSTDTPAGSGTDETTPTNSENNDTMNQKGVITGNGVNIRSEAGTTGKIQGTYNKGDVVTILEIKNGWGRTDKGWVKMDYVNTSGNTTTDNNTNTNTNTNNNNTTGNGSTTVIAKGIVKVKELNIREGAGTNYDTAGSLTYGARVEILEKDGSWGRTKDGWIHMDYIYQDGTNGTNRDSGTVTGNGLRIRSGPGTGYGSLGSYSSGDRVNILEQFTYGNTTWGCTNKGWISLDYVDLDSDDDDDNDSDEASGRTGTITAGELNIREGAGSDYDAVGSYLYGDEVTILETSGNWGRTNQGWISLNYVDFD